MSVRSVFRPAALCALAALTVACRPSAPDTAASADESATATASDAIPAASTASPVEMLARLPSERLDIGTPEASEYLDRFFREGCLDGDERISFDRICQHLVTEGDDPSPGPDFVLGIDAGRIVSAVLTRPAQSLGTGWACTPAEGLDDVRFCYADSVAADARARWSAEWAAFFSAGD